MSLSAVTTTVVQKEAKETDKKVAVAEANSTSQLKNKLAECKTTTAQGDAKKDHP